MSVIEAVSEFGKKKMSGAAFFKMLQLYPPFLFMGVRIQRVSDDCRELDAVLPLRWFAKNAHGTMFGGFMCALSDPLAALMCGKIFPGTETWTKSNSVEFIRTGKTDLVMSIRIKEEDLDSIRAQLEANGKATQVFEFPFRDAKGVEVARARNTIYLRRRASLEV